MRRLTCGLALFSLACAGARPLWPTGTGVPAPESLANWREATEACRGAHLYTAELTVDGVVGSERLRHAVLQGAMTDDGRVYLLAVAPVGPPIFTLAGTDARATLTLPSEQRVVTAPAADIVAALIGFRLSAVDWLRVLSGCVGGAEARDGVRIGDATIVHLADGVTRVRLDADGRAVRLVAGERPDLLVEYEGFLGRWPKAARVTTRPGAAVVADLTMMINQVNVNIELPAGAFTLDVPPTFQPMTLEGLRALGPLGAREGGDR